MIRFGRAKQITKITLDDVRKHPIWTSAHDERHDEEWEKPIIGTSDVTQEILSCPVIAPIITIKLLNMDVFGSAWLAEGEQEIFAISVWQDDQWRTLADVDVFSPPIIFESIPKVLGIEGVRFLCTDPETERARRMA